MKRFTLLFVLLFAVPAQARFQAANTKCTVVNCPVLAAVAGNAAAALRTFTVDVGTFVKLAFQVNYTWSTGTAVTMACSGSLDQGTTYARVTSTAITAGTGTVTPYTDSRPVTASENFILEYDVRTYDKLQCVVGCTGCGANDSLTVYASAARYKTNEEAKVSGQ